jgi:hypothetical protein
LHKKSRTWLFSLRALRISVASALKNGPLTAENAKIRRGSPRRLPAKIHFLCKAIGDNNFRLTQVDQPALQGRGYGLGTVGNAKFAENVVDVTLNRRLANRQADADFFIALASHDQFEHFHLSAG